LTGIQPYSAEEWVQLHQM